MKKIILASGLVISMGCFAADGHGVAKSQTSSRGAAPSVEHKSLKTLTYSERMRATKELTESLKKDMLSDLEVVKKHPGPKSAEYLPAMQCLEQHIDKMIDAAEANRRDRASQSWSYDAESGLSAAEIRRVLGELSNGLAGRAVAQPRGPNDD